MASIARESGIQVEAGEKLVPVVQVSVTAACGRRQAKPGPRMGRGEIITKYGDTVPDNPNIALTGGLVLSWMLSSAMFTLLVITSSWRILANIGSVQRIENTDLLIVEQGSSLLL